MLKYLITILSLTGFSKYDFVSTLIDHRDCILIYRFDQLIDSSQINSKYSNSYLSNSLMGKIYLHSYDTLENNDQKITVFGKEIHIGKIKKTRYLSDPLLFDLARDDDDESFKKINFRNEFIGFEPSFTVSFNVFNKKDLNNIEVSVNILDAVERLVKEVKIPIPSTRKNIPIDIQYDLAGIATGSYYLTINYKSEGNILEQIQRSIFIVSELEPKLNTNLTDNELFEKSIFYTLSEEQVELEIKQIRFLMDDSKSTQFRLLTDVHAKRRALYKFWKQKDIDDDPFINKERLDFEKAVEHANRYYSYGSSETNGWDTDRGRILIRYGFPMFFDNSVARAGQPSSEIWFYGNLAGGTYFYFVDIGNYNRYTLVHSTLRSEVQNEHWIEDYNPAIDDPELIVRDLQYLENFRNGR